MKKQLFIFLFICGICSCKRNDPVSVLHVYGEAGRDTCYSSFICADGNLLICGNTADQGKTYMVLLKADKNGNLLWSKRYLGSQLSKAICVGQSADGNYILCGDTGSTHGTPSLMFLKTDTSGKQVDVKQLQLPFQSLGLKSMIPASGGGYILLAKKNLNGKGMPALIAIDDAGTVKWTGEPATGLINYSNINIEPENLLELDDGFLVTGQMTGNFKGPQGIFVLSAYLMKTDKSGKKIQESTPNFFNQGHATCSAISDSILVTAGLVADSSTSFEDLFVTRVNSSLDTVKWQTFGGKGEEGNNLNFPYCKIIKKQTGGFLICSTSRSFKLGNSLVYIVSIDADGTKQWEKTYGGIKGDFFPSCIIPFTAGGYLISGHTSGFGNSINELDFFSMKIDENGEMIE